MPVTLIFFDLDNVNSQHDIFSQYCCNRQSYNGPGAEDMMVVKKKETKLAEIGDCDMYVDDGGETEPDEQ